jgi:Domain of unknown function (DUF4340)
MNSKNTFIWFVIAAGLLAFIFAYQLFERSKVSAPSEILPDLRAATVTGIQVIPNGAPEISAVRTNNNWILTEPIAYPARGAAIDALLDALQKLKQVSRIPPSELSANHNANADYGLETPQISLVIQSAGYSRQIQIGNKTGPGDQVYVRVVGIDGLYLADVGWLKYIPQTSADWRDTALVSMPNGCDSITLTNGVKIIELHSNPTNRLWQMTRPLTARANSDYINTALQQLQTASVSHFITDNSNADLGAFGLQPAILDLWLGQNSNSTAIHIGKSWTNDPAQVFAKREGWNAIVTTTNQPLLPWYGKVNDFRDPYLLELTAPVAEIETIGPGTNHIILQRSDTNTWKIVGETFPVDVGTVQFFIQTLAGLHVSEFVKDVVTPADLPAYGLSDPSRQITLRSAIGDTNAVIAQLLFGSVRTNEVFVRRADEDFIYAITPEDYSRLADRAAWQFRERSIWNFSEKDVASITVRQNGQMRKMVHTGLNQWSLVAGSGFINTPAIEEVAHELGIMGAEVWVSRGIANPAALGFKPDNLSITVTLKNGQSQTVDFGGEIAKRFVMAAVTLDGERWAFIYPPGPYTYIVNYLAIPGNVP